MGCSRFQVIRLVGSTINVGRLAQKRPRCFRRFFGDSEYHSFHIQLMWSEYDSKEIALVPYTPTSGRSQYPRLGLIASGRSQDHQAQKRDQTPASAPRYKLWRTFGCLRCVTLSLSVCWTTASSMASTAAIFSSYQFYSRATRQHVRRTPMLRDPLLRFAKADDDVSDKTIIRQTTCSTSSLMDNVERLRDEDIVTVERLAMTYRPSSPSGQV